MAIASLQRVRYFLLPLLLWPIPGSAEERLPTIELDIGGTRLTLEVAQDEQARRRGLMYRDHLPADRGMLFIWSRPARWRMWMKNTLIPLDVAFVDANHVISNIETMQPHTTDRHTADRAVRYALEVNAGWFARHGIEAGIRIRGLAEATD